MANTITAQITRNKILTVQITKAAATGINALRFQGVDIDSSAPTNGYSFVYNSSLTKYILTSVVAKSLWTTDTDTGATLSFDLSVSAIQNNVLDADKTISLTNVEVGRPFILSLKQDATGGRAVTWFTGISWTGGSPPILTVTPNKTDTFGFICTSAGVYQGYTVGKNI